MILESPGFKTLTKLAQRKDLRKLVGRGSVYKLNYHSLLYFLIYKFHYSKLSSKLQKSGSSTSCTKQCKHGESKRPQNTRGRNNMHVGNTTVYKVLKVYYIKTILRKDIVCYQQTCAQTRTQHQDSFSRHKNTSIAMAYGIGR